MARAYHLAQNDHAPSAERSVPSRACSFRIADCNLGGSDTGVSMVTKPRRSISCMAHSVVSAAKGSEIQNTAASDLEMVLIVSLITVSDSREIVLFAKNAASAATFAGVTRIICMLEYMLAIAAARLLTSPIFSASDTPAVKHARCAANARRSAITRSSRLLTRDKCNTRIAAR